MLHHGGCAAWNGRGVLILGRPGAGKSDLLLRLMDRQGWLLVSDDQVSLSRSGNLLSAAAPAGLSGMLEVRGVGVMEDLEVAASAPVLLVVACVPGETVPRLPAPRSWNCLGVGIPIVDLHAIEASAPRKVEVALLAASGQLGCRAGAFSPA